MARPTKRRIEGGKPTSGRVTPKGGPQAAKSEEGESHREADPTVGGRYTAPTSRALHKPSPQWVPVLMFACWGIGLLMIMLNYMELLPGTSGGANGWYLITGLILILAGIITATQYR